MKDFKLVMDSVREICKIDLMRIFTGILNCIIEIVNSMLVSLVLLGLIFEAFFVQQSFFLVVLFVSIQAIEQAFYYIYSEWYSNVYKKKSNYRIQENIQLKIHNKCIQYDSILLNRSEFYDRYNWINVNAAKNIIGIFDAILNYLQYVITLILTGGMFIYFDPLIAVLVVISIGVTFACSMRQNENYYKKAKEIKNYSRYNDYVKRVFSLPQYREDIKMYEITTALEKAFERNHHKIIHEQKIANKRILIIDILSNITHLVLGSNLPYVILGLKAILYDTYTVPKLAILVNIIIKFRSSFQSALSLMPQLKKNVLYLKDYYEFMNYEPKIKRNEEGLEAKKGGANSLDIRNVSFAYEEGRKILKNINLSIKAGERIAIVGYNGAGKSTLIKLLLRLYLPQEGRIEMDGVSAEEYKLQSYRDRFGVVFQNSVIYAANVAENVMMQPVDLSKEAEKVWKALERCGMKAQIESYINGIDTTMTKEFDESGIELSGGQVQKIALARVFARDYGIIILDEPSSALDSVSEYEVYKNILELAADRTFIVISHRLLITKDVDRIILLENGEIVECGSHSELLKKNGKYAEMWNTRVNQFS